MKIPFIYNLRSVTQRPVSTALTALGIGTTGLVQQQPGAPNSNPITVGAGTQGTVVNFTNSTGAARTLTGVAAGSLAATSVEAVNGSQVNAALTSVATNLGGGSTFNAKTGAVTAPTYNIGGSSVTNVGAAITALQASSPLQYSTAAAPTTANGLNVSNDVTLVGTGGGPVVIHNLAPGVAGTDGVNVNQLTALKAGSVQYSTTQTNTVAFSSPNNGGTSGAPVTLTNIAPGAVNASSSDAVNGAQLYATNKAISNLSSFAATTQKQAFAGTAVALAAAGLRYDDRPGKLSTAAGMGYYHGQFGFAGGLGTTSENGLWRMNAAVSFTPGNGIKPDVGVNAGLSYTWN